MERTTLHESRGYRGVRDWPMTIVLGLALLFCGVPQPEIAALEWRD